MKIDFHVHSMYSKRPAQWLLQKIGCSESYTEPVKLYEIAKKRGMTHVTISDHNSIEGVLQIAHLPDVFISEEITTYFPEDNCKMHIVASDINEEQHDKFQAIRKNIYDLTAYLNHEKIFHTVAHPLFPVNDRLTFEHIEKLMVLFECFEINGARNTRENKLIRSITDNLTPEELSRIITKYNLPIVNKPKCEKIFIGGSDDHSSLNIARTYTRITGTSSLKAFLKSPEMHNIEIITDPSSPKTMAHNLYSIAYQFYREKFDLAKFSDQDLFIEFLDKTLIADVDHPKSAWQVFPEVGIISEKELNAASISKSLLTLLKIETQNAIMDNPSLFSDASTALKDTTIKESNWYDVVNQISDRVIHYFADHLMDHLSGANVFNIFHTLGSAGGLYTLLSPYFVSYSLFSRDRAFSRELLHRFLSKREGSTSSSETVKVAHLTDTYYEVNGVALTLQKQVSLARTFGKDLTVITCNDRNSNYQGNTKNFSPIGVYEIPEYPEQKIFYPPFLEMLSYVYENRFTHIHSATPGPIGLAALAISKILKLPITGTYHTSIPQYARSLTGDSSIEDITWKYVLWYYNQMDVVMAPSTSTKEELVRKGMSGNKIKLYPRGVDTSLYHPRKKNGYYKKWLTETNSILKLLYVGRVSKEKNLDILADAYKELHKNFPNAYLVIVGEGPFLDEMKEKLAGLPCLFTGYIRGEELAEVYASSDFFIFPSTTDTFGNVVLEAQSSGLPVIVTDEGGPCENMIPGETGIVVESNQTDSLFKAMQFLVQDSSKRKDMGIAARNYMKNRSFDSAFLKTWDMYKDQDISDFGFAA